MLKQQGESAWRYKACRLMETSGLVSKQLKQHRYRNIKEESVIAENKLNRQFSVAEQNQFWCGDVTYV